MIELTWGVETDIGLARKTNEDSVWAGDNPPLFLVADGMGGHSSGDVASAILVDFFRHAPAGPDLDVNWVLSALDAADLAIRSGTDGGTTVSGLAAVRQGGRPYWLVFNVGDSRVYERVEESVRQITVDHSVVQEMVDAGSLTTERARHHPERNVITRAMGSPHADPDLWLVPMVIGQRMLACSDGMTGDVEFRQLAELLREDLPAADIAQRLIELALRSGTQDNVSAVVVDVVGLDEPTADDFEHTVPQSVISTPEHTVPRPVRVEGRLP